MIRKEDRCGRRVLVIDIRYRKKSGARARYRKDAQVQTQAAATAEERRILACISAHGEPVEPTPGATQTAAPSITFGEAITLFRQGKAVVRLKASSRHGYEEIIASRLDAWAARSLTAIDFAAVNALDAGMVGEGLSASRRRNVAITVRSILRAAVDAGELAAMPPLPRLPVKGRKIQSTLTVAQVDAILTASLPAWRLAFGLACYAGLRAGEVRALRWMDVDIADGLLVVRLARTQGVTSTPKSGHEREIPLSTDLLAMLREAGPGAPHAVVARTGHGEPWGQSGLLQAFRRAQTRAGLTGWRFHDLRHHFVSTLFRGGAGAPAVQALAGHLHLSAYSARLGHPYRPTRPPVPATRPDRSAATALDPAGPTSRSEGTLG